MAGKFEAAVPNKYGNSSSNKITIDIFDESNPYLEIRVAEINFNIIEAAKTNPVFTTQLNLA